MTIQELHKKTKPARISKEVKKILSRLLKSKNIKELAADLNRIRLDETGKDIDGQSMRTFNARGSDSYSDNTINIKAGKGQTTDHFTAKDTGKLHDSFRGVNSGNGIKVTANNKRMSLLSENINTDRMLGFSNEDILFLKEELRPEVFKALKIYLQ